VALRGKGAEFGAAIGASRARFWQAVASGADVEEARADFSARLWEKDLMYLMISLPEGINGPLAVVLPRLAGGAAGIDGGIRRTAQSEFARWVGRIRFHLGASAREHIMPRPDHVIAAMKLAHEEQALYLRARDWAEVDAAGIEFPWDTSAREHGLMLLQRYGPVRSLADVRKSFDELMSLFGEARVLEAAERMRNARRNEDGVLASPQALGVAANHPADAFAELLVAGSGEAYLKQLAWRQGHSVTEASLTAQRLVWSYGEQAATRMTEHVRHAPRDAQSRIVPPDELASPEINVGGDGGRAVLGLLALADLPGWVRAIAALGTQAMTRAQVDAAVRALGQKHGEQKLLAAADTLRTFWYTLQYRESPRTREQWQNLERQRGAGAFPTTDYALLTQILEKGATTVLGDPGARTADERIVLQAEAHNVSDWEKRRYIFVARWGNIVMRMTEDTLRYPDRDWLALSSQLGMVADHYRNPTWVAGRNLRGDRLNAQWLHDATRTVQIHCAVSGEPDGDACAIMKMTEQEFEDIWPRLPEGFRQRPSPEPGAGGIGDFVGTWTGQAGFMQRRGGYPLRMRFTLPQRAGQPFATMEYPAMPCTVQYFFAQVKGGEYYFTERRPDPPDRCGTGISAIKLVRETGALQWLWYQQKDQLPFFHGPDVFSPPSWTAASTLVKNR
jgi:hypothetical protein